MEFARQGSASQAYFMRQATIEEGDSAQSGVRHKVQNYSSILNSVIQRRDNRMHFARQGSASQAYFMRQATIEEGSSAPSGVPHKSSGYERSCSGFEAPLFSRPVRKEPNLANSLPMVQGCVFTMPQPPKFAQPSTRTNGRKQLHSKKKILSSQSDGIEWSPRMDVAESRRNYVMTVEIPGVNINDIRVEVDNQKLTVSGRRLSNDSISTYHKREILQGPYQVVWPLPADVNKDSVSAEFLDGFLQITIPKL
ncbi:heat shock protein 16 [Corylus avellana]|uniref:heat shock protein 16 n=1 Tax=Corylus avellana TaxID=13451 RepID=UPI00286B1E2F|nr:heat shock protein 16 [Corylus avellana]